MLFLSSLAVFHWRWPCCFCCCRAVPCCAVLFGAVFCRVCCCRALLFAVFFFGAVWCRGALCRLVCRCVVLCCVACVGSYCSAPPSPRCCPSCQAVHSDLSCCAVSGFLRGAVLHCAGALTMCCSLLVWSALFMVTRAVVRCCVLCCFLWRSVVWWCCPVVWCGVWWCPVSPYCVLWCCAALWCCAVGLCSAFFTAACGCFSSYLTKPLLFVSTFEYILKTKLKCFLLCGPLLLCSVVRCCAVRPCFAGFLCCVLPGGVVRVGYVPWFSSPPCWDAQYRTVMVFNYLPLCDPASFSVSTGMMALVTVAVAGVVVVGVGSLS